MRRRNTSILVRIIAILFLTATIILAIVTLIGYSRQRNNYPAGMTIGGVPVGGSEGGAVGVAPGWRFVPPVSREHFANEGVSGIYEMLQNQAAELPYRLG